MKDSELIFHIVNIVAVHGDLDVMDDCGELINNIDIDTIDKYKVICLTYNEDPVIVEENLKPNTDNTEGRNIPADDVGRDKDLD